MNTNQLGFEYGVGAYLRIDSAGRGDYQRSVAPNRRVNIRRINCGGGGGRRRLCHVLQPTQLLLLCIVAIETAQKEAGSFFERKAAAIR